METKKISIFIFIFFLFRLKSTGEHTIVGRSVMVHAGVDDLGKGGHELSPTTGNAGGRIACGEVKLA